MHERLIDVLLSAHHTHTHAHTHTHTHTHTKDIYGHSYSKIIAALLSARSVQYRPTMAVNQYVKSHIETYSQCHLYSSCS